MQPARSPHHKLFLLDGPIMETTERRNAKIAEMAMLLVDHNAFADYADVRLTLRLSGYSLIEVDLLGPAAWELALQHAAVDREMKQP